MGGYMRKLFLLALSAAMLPAAAYAQDITDDGAAEPTLIGVCPDGGYESGCSQADMEKAITLANDYLITLRSRCLYQSEARCSVISSGSFGSMERGGPMIWQHMQLSPKDGPAHDMIVVAEGLSGEDIKLVSAHQVWGNFSSPDMIDNSDDGVLFHIPGRVGGKGNADILLLRTKEKWTEIDMDRWFDQVNEMLPKGFQIRAAVDFNFREMHASSPVWREDDGECCANGGSVQIDYLIKDGALIVARLGFDETKPVGNTQYIDAPGVNVETQDDVPDDAAIAEAYAADAEAANAAFRKYQDPNNLPIDNLNMARCSAYWDRWKYGVDSMNTPAFVEALDPALSLQSAEKQASYWLERVETKDRINKSTTKEINAISAKANEDADEVYAKWMTTNPKPSYVLLHLLGSCYIKLNPFM
tara:strand:- start:3099 stop:4346 length:1248 start_codon:yes stop_codon:yes gene_type:complete